ncbi:bifunctional 3-(3-hydroxy-phenyl)propionate/3-hydroxycinnamic acid hydroxylase [Paraburkholderia panacisoli]|uniref:Bifunctional 3-(3-hydroxy-phenyl)propionate/3-hydroxycinnamic acid hydroxylase n=1 Tax=Paraburkholderia panacisoli TaxID=2603818 RepID=A0A5B0GGE7_9BURK|nr:bifunctional 3-(3-hydroxy-phenyl)propionate/3-hydroxycinnamic acid hydroxylase [Paraburkholderia panacisoli]KAA1002396.1 bifunctional 3-(3-hydroxy-phenyl)propionate/3-hydroxycinnamic acid hydroxylase [Paraburkholderia panacisoli]
MRDFIESSARSAPDYDVAIVGFGPTGATLANLLALRGLKVVVFERDKDVFVLPRAVHFDAECMRVFQTIGIAESMLPDLFIGPGMKFVNARGELLIDWSRPPGIGPHGWCASYKFHQPQLERTLRTQLAATGLADVRLRHEVFAIDEREDHVRIRFEDTAQGRLSHTTARYVVGCDGARSTVRRFIGTELADLKSHERWVVVDVLLDRERADLGDYSIQYCDPERPTTYTRGPHNRRRWEIMVMPGDDEHRLGTSAWIWERLARWITPADAQLERSAIYTFHSVIAQGWRRGRLLIAGDAAHQTPPFMGQGMAAGIRDAANLAWKLADVVGGRLPDSLLDTYESEREPHVREFIETAVQLGTVIQATDRAAADTRDREMTAAIRQFKTPQPRLGDGYHDAAQGGQIAPQPCGADGARLDDAVGYRFALVALDELAQHAQAALDTERDQPVVVVPAGDGALRDWLASTGARAVLLRPDRYVYGVANDPAGVDALLERTGVYRAISRQAALA